MPEETSKKTVMEEKKNIIKLPHQEQLAWSLQTGAWICFASGLLILLEGMSKVDWVTQTGLFVAAVVVFGFGGYLQHSYNRWFIRQLQ